MEIDESDDEEGEIEEEGEDEVDEEMMSRIHIKLAKKGIDPEKIEELSETELKILLESDVEDEGVTEGQDEQAES